MFPRLPTILLFFTAASFFLLTTCKKIDRITKVKTESVINITDTSGTANAYIIDLNEKSSHEDYGFCFSPSDTNPTVNNNKVSLGKLDDKGSFTSFISGLNGGTKYYLNSYVKDNNEYIYGKPISFTTINGLPTVISNPVTGITESSATGGGNVTNDGGASVTVRGVCWSTSQNPTIADSKTTDGSGTGIFSSNITGLSSNIIYYVRAYATNSVGTAYGSQIVFTTNISIPIVTTNTISNITTTTSIGGGNVTYDGGSSVTTRGVCWSASQNPTIADPKTTDGTGTGIFSSSITGLSSGITYYVRAYATNVAGTGYGAEVSFTTQSIPSVITSAISNITPTASTGGGNVTSNGGATVTARGVCWSTSPNPSTANFTTTNGTGTGSFTSSISGLTPLTTYYVKAYAINSIGTAYGTEISFTTQSPTLPTVTTNTISNIAPTTSTGGGNVTYDGGASVTDRGVCWSTSQNPTTANSKTNDGSGTGSFSSSITGLTGNTTYYVRAYATNSVGTAYGSQVSFSFSVGTNYGGGVVFYIDGTGIQGLISAQTDQSTGTSWGCEGTLLNNTSSNIGTGWTNTQNIVSGCATPGIAARICDDLILNSYTDWYLPSANELSLMYNNKLLIGGFTTYYYWSSTEFNGNVAPGPGTYAHIVYFTDGTLTYTYKNTSVMKVRAIRAF